MPEFEITAEYSDGRHERQVVSASNWIEAWRRVGEGGSEDDSARISVRSLGEEVDVEIATSACRYRLRSRSLPGSVGDEIGVEMDFPFPEPHGSRDDELDDTAHGDGKDLVLPATGPHPRPTDQEQDTVRLSSLVEKPEKRGRLQTTTEDNPVQNAQPSESSPLRGSGRKESSRNQDTRVHAPATDPRELPQLFTPMAEFGGTPLTGLGGGRDRGASVSWAVETVWHQVPSRIVLGLMILGRDVTVTHARGEGVRLLQGARGRLDEWPSAIVLRAPSRMRFGGDAPTLWFRSTDGIRQPVEVKSAIWTPLDTEKDSGRDGGGAMRTVVMAIDAPRATGFTEGEMSALRYLAQMVASKLA